MNIYSSLKVLPEIYKQTENVTVKPTEIKGRKYLYVISCPNLNQNLLQTSTILIGYRILHFILKLLYVTIKS